ncbi:MAG: type II toxin-antitoxin system VapB family antitoxin [Gammaproteobacteria bacterium]|nr:type II toxin-antitoxin system VapB family antitoxin [Gammaproteobacteria bacterium]
MQAINIDDGLLQKAVQLTGLRQEQALETALKLLINTAQTRLWQQQAMNDPQLLQAAQEFLSRQWTECNPADLDKLL